MNRLWCSIATSIAATWMAASVAAESPRPSLPVMGDMVDADLPVTYRLPPVAIPAVVATIPSPLFSAPIMAAESTLTLNQTSPPQAAVQGREGPDLPLPVVVAPHDLPAISPVGTPDVGWGDVGDDIESSPEQGADVNHEAAEAKPQAGVLTVDVARTAELTSQLLPAVQRGFGLAQRGALYAARTEFVQVLRRVAQAHDAAADTSDHSRALAAGLRALDEAEDFVPPGVQLEAELDVRITASSHRTRVLPAEPEEVSPSKAVAFYHEFAQKQLRQAIAGEQAGSMALHGLGTIYARLAARNDDDVQLTRSAMTMYAAALEACPNNHLAANELGVLVCRSGRAEEAAALFMQTIDFAPSAVAYHNLAIAQQRSGRMGEAVANEFESQRLAAEERARGDVSRRVGVRWVTPQEMARGSQPVQRTATQAVQAPPPAPVPPAKSAWQRVVDSTKALPLPGGRAAKDDLGPMPEERVARPMEIDAENQTLWR